ncbi:helix-turn-helix domain-containing protein [Cryptosporangium aurantiacum]|uniref:Helix-turn-helix domain-containing protein n=1 Tax=Cryptosporangium aurantiacum TaxID=134849 RepID=A0A1M7TYR9_9ACTN|nr:helix-turn-helix transcriptional regulator [Cryptosporangium aurantiacum]SHN75827.1 Helix-turn-helix domain-containing protein [Cryptosporangium aurantiacum]
MESDAALEVFGMALRHLRRDAGLSLRRLGQTAHYDYTRISRVERGEHLPDHSLVTALDEAVGAGGLLCLLRSLIPGPGRDATRAANLSRPMSTFGALCTDEAADMVTVELRTPDGRTVRVSLSRRDFAKLLAGGTFAAFLPAGVIDLDAADRVARVLAEPTRTDPQVIAYFGNALGQHYAADKTLGPRHLVRLVTAEIDVLAELRRSSRPGTSGPLLRVLAQYAEMAGWLYQDAGDITAAMHWSDRASQWAQGVGDQQMVAYMLVRKSNIALRGGDPVDVVELAAAAGRTPGPVSPLLRALAAQQEARGWALLGDADQFQRRLEIAAGLLCDHPGDLDHTAPVYLHHYDLATLEEQSASGWRDCGRADAAVEILERQIIATPPGQRRDYAHQQAKLANALVATASPDPERASEIGLACVPVAAETGSARITGELRTLTRALTTRWPNLVGSRELREALAS